MHLTNVRGCIKNSLQEGAGDEERQKYKEYRNHYNKLKRTRMNDYYSTKCRVQKKTQGNYGK